MGRPFYPHEVDDPDLDWLVSNFLYERPDFLPVEYGLLPLVLIPLPQNSIHKHLIEPKDRETLEQE